MSDATVFLKARDEGAKRTVDQVGDSVKSFAGRVKDALAPLRDLTIVATGVRRAFDLITNAVKAPIEQARQQATAEIQLAAALAKSGQEVARNVQAFRNFASARQAVTQFADESTIHLAALGVELGLTARQAELAIPAIHDRAIQLGREPTEIMRQLALSVAGTAESWGRLGVVVDQAATPAEKFTQAIAQMRSGVSELEGELPTSALIHLKNALGEVLEGIGGVIVSTGTFQAIMRAVTETAKSFSDALADPEKLRAIATAIDTGVAAALRALGAAAGGALSAVAGLLRGLESLAQSLGFVANMLSGGSLKRAARAAFEEASQKLQEATGDSKEYRDALGEVEQALRAVQVLSGQVDFGSKAVEEAAVKVDTFFDNLAAKIQAAGIALPDVMSKIFGRLDQQRSVTVGVGLVLDLKQTEEAIQLARDLGTNMAAGLRDTFSNAAVGAFDPKVGWGEAVKRAGDDARNIFVGTMAQGFFDPIRAAFQGLAQELVKPFTIIGKAIGSIITGPLNAVAEAFSSVITKMFAELLGQQVATQAAVIPAVVAAAAASAAAWVGPATLATIATLGGAAAQAPLAIAAAQQAAAALQIVPKAAEGGWIEPRPGGRPVIVGEAGERELILPERKIPSFAAEVMERSGAGVGPAQIFVTVNVERVDATSQSQIRDLGDLLGERIRASFSGRRV